MKSLKKILGLVIFTLIILGMFVTVYASSKYNTPAEAVAGLTGRTVESVVQERKDSKKTFGAIANEAGKLEEFKLEKIAIKKAKLEKQVAEGKITADKADKVLEAIKANSLNCNGNGSGGQIGRNSGVKFGEGGQGLGKSITNGKRQGNNSLRKGSGIIDTEESD